MPRSNYLMIPISGNGVLVDPGTKDIIQKAMIPPFGYTDLLLYSHGWWTTAQSAMVDYNRFLMGISPIAVTADTTSGIPSRALLGLGLHWPSMVSEDSNTPLTVLQPLTYFNRSKMADAVGEHGGYSLLRLALEARNAASLPQPRIQLVGHSFGCKVVCAALEQLAETSPPDLLANLEINAVLLQAAFDFDALDPGKSYGRVLSAFPKLRILASTSQLDTAIGEEYVLVQRVMDLFFGTPTPGLGSAGPSPATIAAAGGASQIQVGPGFTTATAGSLSGRLTVADLTPLHQSNPDGNVAFSGHHSDIFHDEIYRLMTAFFFT